MTGATVYCEAQVRCDDRERYLTALFAPADRRPGLFALYAFNLEIAKIPDLVSEPQLGEIRYQWWREALDGIYRQSPIQNPVVVQLSETVQRYRLPRETFERLIDTRSADLNGAPADTLEGLIEYAGASSSALVSLALRVLGVGENDAAAHKAGYHVGVAWALAALSPGDDQITAAARDHLSLARSFRQEIPKAALPALLPGVLAGRRLKRTGANRSSPLDQLVLYLHAVTGRY